MSDTEPVNTTPEHENDKTDFSLWEKAMSEMEETSKEPKNEYEAIHQVLQELSEKYGVEFTVHDGKA